jgi:UDP-GlcNAc:undecaprenyl-phosphate GlcNAc-1-phosphate transferase
MHFLIVFITSLLISLVATNFVRKIALKYKIGSLPDQRKIHVGFIPHMGGIGIYLGGIGAITLAMILIQFSSEIVSEKYLAVVFASTIMLITGIYDDLRGMNARTKFTLQFIASTIVIVSGCVVDRIVNPFGNPIELNFWAIPVTYLWLIGITNAFNLLDGLDGLAGGVSFIALATFGIIAYQSGEEIIFIISLAFMGSVLGFLRYNYHPATIFMGDTGSLFLGFLIASISIQGLRATDGNIPLLIPLITLAVPIGDTILAFFRRLNQGKHPFSADKDHLHHRLIFLGLTHKQAVHILYIFSFLFGLSAYLITLERTIYGLFSLVAVFIIAIVSLKRFGYLEAQKIKTYLGDRSIISVKQEMAPLSMRRFWHKFLLLLSDIVSIHLAVLITLWFRAQYAQDAHEIIYYFSRGASLVIAIFYLGVFALHGLFNMRWDVARFDQVMRVSRCILFGSLFVFIITFDPDDMFSLGRLSIIPFMISLLLFVNFGRLLLIFIEKKFAILEYAPHNTLLIGASDKAKSLVMEIRSNPHLLYNIIGIADKVPLKDNLLDLKFLGNYQNIGQIIRRHGVEEVIITIYETRDELLNIVAQGENMGVSFKIIPEMYDVISGHKTEEIIGHPLIKLFPEHMKPWQWLTKRILDILIALFFLFLCLPLILIILIIQLFKGIQPFFLILDRIGKGGKIFGLLVFNTEQEAMLISRILKRTGSYKLPHLFNLLFASMTLVGPKAISMEAYHRLQPKIKFYNRRFMIRPGITGWSQLKDKSPEKTVNEYGEEFKQDLFYLENMSLSLDLRILLRSVAKLFLKRKRKI